MSETAARWRRCGGQESPLPRLRDNPGNSPRFRWEPNRVFPLNRIDVDSPSDDSPAVIPPVTQPVSPPANPFSEQATPGSPFGGQFTSNPYLSPQTPGGLPPATGEMIQAKVRIPATGMLVVSGLMLAVQLIGAAVLVVLAVSGNGRLEEVLVNVVGVVIGLALSGVIVLGAIKMRRLENYGLAMTAAVISMLPCTSGCCLFSMPFGIWSLIVLLDPQVKQAFR